MNPKTIFRKPTWVRTGDSSFRKGRKNLPTDHSLTGGLSSTNSTKSEAKQMGVTVCTMAVLYVLSTFLLLISDKVGIPKIEGWYLLNIFLFITMHAVLFVSESCMNREIPGSSKAFAGVWIFNGIVLIVALGMNMLEG